MGAMRSPASRRRTVGLCFMALALIALAPVITVRLPPILDYPNHMARMYVLAKLPDAEVDALQTGVWGRKLAPDHVLRDGDRVELYRPLKVDPKLARRERFKGQGAGRTGLFAKRRAGAKSGY